jgi:hypothetical protein
MRSARAAIALLAVLAIDAPAQDASANFVVETEISPASGDRYLVQFRVRDAMDRVVAERMVAFAGEAGAGVSVGATSARRCSSGRAKGYCLDLVVGTGEQRKRAETFISARSQRTMTAARD